MEESAEDLFFCLSEKHMVKKIQVGLEMEISLKMSMNSQIIIK